MIIKKLCIFLVFPFLLLSCASTMPELESVDVTLAELVMPGAEEMNDSDASFFIADSSIMQVNLEYTNSFFEVDQMRVALTSGKLTKFIPGEYILSFQGYSNKIGEYSGIYTMTFEPGRIYKVLFVESKIESRNVDGSDFVETEIVYK